MFSGERDLTIYFKKSRPIILAFIIFLAIVLSLIAVSVRQNNGHFVYALDDAYIHMSIAKNLALHGIWGVTPYEFSSSDSSLSWPLLLAASNALFGVNSVTPLILNIVFALLILWLVSRELKKAGVGEVYELTGLLAVIFVTPLPTVTLCGMEHMMHTFLSLWFIVLVLEFMPENKVQNIFILILSFLLTSTRYEAVFLVFIAGLVLLSRKKYGFILLLYLAAILPVVVFGIISLRHGWFFLPNSVMLRGVLPNIHEQGSIYFPGRRAFAAIVHNRHILILFLSIIFLFVSFPGERKRTRFQIPLIFIFVGTLILHAQFADVGAFYRYEAYLMTMGVFTMGIVMSKTIINDKRIMNKIYFSIMVLFLLPLVFRGICSFPRLVQSSKNTYDQHFMKGYFLKKYYTGSVVAAGDIGVMTFLADIRLFDICGLGTIETARARVASAFKNELNPDIEELAVQKKVEIGVIGHYTTVLQPIPSHWEEVGSWTSHNAWGEDVLGFYIINPTFKKGLIKNLMDFSQALPVDIKQEIKKR